MQLSWSYDGHATVVFSAIQVSEEDSGKHVTDLRSCYWPNHGAMVANESSQSSELNAQISPLPN